MTRYENYKPVRKSTVRKRQRAGYYTRDSSGKSQFEKEAAVYREAGQPVSNAPQVVASREAGGGDISRQPQPSQTVAPFVQQYGKQAQQVSIATSYQQQQNYGYKEEPINRYSTQQQDKSLRSLREPTQQRVVPFVQQFGRKTPPVSKASPFVEQFGRKPLPVSFGKTNERIRIEQQRSIKDKNLYQKLESKASSYLWGKAGKVGITKETIPKIAESISSVSSRMVGTQYIPKTNPFTAGLTPSFGVGIVPDIVERGIKFRKTQIEQPKIEGEIKGVLVKPIKTGVYYGISLATSGAGGIVGAIGKGASTGAKVFGAGVKVVGAIGSGLYVGKTIAELQHEYKTKGLKAASELWGEKKSTEIAPLALGTFTGFKIISGAKSVIRKVRISRNLKTLEKYYGLEKGSVVEKGFLGQAKVKDEITPTARLYSRLYSQTPAGKLSIVDTGTRGGGGIRPETGFEILKGGKTPSIVDKPTIGQQFDISFTKPKGSTTFSFGTEPKVKGTSKLFPPLFGLTIKQPNLGDIKTNFDISFKPTLDVKPSTITSADPFISTKPTSSSLPFVQPDTLPIPQPDVGTRGGSSTIPLPDTIPIPFETPTPRTRVKTPSPSGVPVVPPPLSFPELGGIGGGRIEKFRMFKLPKMKKGYTPSLIGLQTGATLPKLPKGYVGSGAGVRLPVAMEGLTPKTKTRKKKKKKKKR